MKSLFVIEGSSPLPLVAQAGVLHFLLMLDYEEALARILATIPSPKPEPVALA